MVPTASNTTRSLLVVFAAVGVVQAANLTSLVNLFIGTASGANGGSGGNAFPGAAIPHAMAKVGIDVNETPRQAGYIHDNSTVTGISLMHDEGTGGNTAGGYGLFPLFPLLGSNCTFSDCPVGINQRQALRAANTDAASPGYFTTTLVNGIKFETTSTRRAGLIRFTYPSSTTPNHVVVDLTDDLQRSFQGNGRLTFDSTSGRVELFGTYFQSYGESNYTAYGCYDFTPPSSSPLVGTQKIVANSSGTYQSPATAATPLTFTPSTAANFSAISYAFAGATIPAQAGALISLQGGDSVTVRFGISMISTAQACANAESEVPSWDFDAVRAASEGEWESVLEKVQVNVAKENANVVELLYSSLYRSHLVPANLTDENPYWDNTFPFYDALFCSWDTFRTVHPFLSLVSPREWAGIVNTYVDGWRHTGFIPECRANTKPGFVQGGDDGMPILGDFAVKYAAHASALGVPLDDLYQALVDTAENTPDDWYTVGRQNTAWTTFDYIPTAWVDPSGKTGLPTREASRTLEYAVGDFAVRQAAKVLNKPASDIEKYTNRSMGFRNIWDPNQTSDGFNGFMQKRFANGTFDPTPPNACSPVDPVSHSCARGTDNNASSWEYSFFVPHSMATMVNLMGGNETFISRLDHYYSAGYFLAGNEPGFQTPWLYHYANRPDLSALRVRDVVFNNFNTGVGGIPGNDDSAAMAALLLFHILGMYPVPASKQLLIGSPLVSGFKLTNDLLGTTTSFVVDGFDPNGLAAAPPSGSAVFVKQITIRGKPSESLCWIDFDDVVGGGEIVITVDADQAAAQARGCGSGSKALPDSLGTGGF
ncbi:hypothetical protein PUNSTDRAFT_116292 [Punctularia strigosozonata HHB-11173 SS5]|uniref:Glycoside hydrolase family 92 protein n=1 Tax=Punctularia strigosozonata (strain HHB-11173) TaxID=741275 RepID=R7S434_PUNST|nr:uncharacterized protein PUNSTDRAFT_116292 [Punctularia strigosozonata HHB-11173 SS5]EIN04614.1 hypothetical protein PUNSTDRAFT_116292 [Punctularia strigosozonata HHB-11173 SS5]